MSYTYSPYNDLVHTARQILGYAQASNIVLGGSQLAHERLVSALALVDAEIKFRDENLGLIEQAREEYENYSDNKVEIDDDPLMTDADKHGCWVGAWVWVTKPDPEDAS